MEFHWSKENCGTPLLLVTKSDLAWIIAEESYKFYIENPNFLDTKLRIEKGKHLSNVSFLWIAHAVEKRIKEMKIGCPFEHLNNKKGIEKYFWRYKNGLWQEHPRFEEFRFAMWQIGYELRKLWKAFWVTYFGKYFKWICVDCIKQDMTLKLKEGWQWKEKIRTSHNDELLWKCDLCGYRGDVYWLETVREMYGTLGTNRNTH